MNLISTVIGIGLLALTIGAGISYINPNASAAAEAASVIASGFQALTQAYQSRQMTGAAAPDAASWESALFPAYGFEPKPPDGTGWSYASSDAGRWFCLSAPKATAALLMALASVGKRYAAASYLVSAKCGDAPATTATTATTAATKTPAPAVGGRVAATLWITREGS